MLKEKIVDPTFAESPKNWWTCFPRLHVTGREPSASGRGDSKKL